MSGPKCYHYVVVEDPAVVAAREEAAALVAARTRAAGALARLSRLEEEAAGLRARHGSAITAIASSVAPSATTSAEMLVAAENLERMATEAEARLQREVGEARKASFVAQLAGDASGPPPEAGLDRLIAAAAAQAERAAAEGLDSEPDSRIAFAEECARVFDRVRIDAPAEAREDAERTFEVALSSSGEERAPLLIDRLRAAVRSANAAAEERDRRQKQVDALFGGLAGVEESEATRLRKMLLEERERGRAVELLTAEVERARQAARVREEAARAEQARLRVSEALEESLKELGYGIQPGFETALANGGSAFAQRAGWSDHAMRALLDPVTSELRLHVVRDETPHASRSENVTREKELCADRPALERALAARGVRLDPRELIEPGRVPVAIVPLADTALPKRRRAAARRAREQARE